MIEQILQLRNKRYKCVNCVTVSEKVAKAFTNNTVRENNEKVRNETRSTENLKEILEIRMKAIERRTAETIKLLYSR